MPVCGSTSPAAALKGQVAKNGPNSSRNTPCTTWSSVERMGGRAGRPARAAGGSGGDDGRFHRRQDAAQDPAERDAEDEQIRARVGRAPLEDVRLSVLGEDGVGPGRRPGPVGG